MEWMAFAPLTILKLVRENGNSPRNQTFMCSKAKLFGCLVSPNILCENLFHFLQPFSLSMLSLPSHSHTSCNHHFAGVMQSTNSGLEICNSYRIQIFDGLNTNDPFLKLRQTHTHTHSRTRTNHFWVKVFLNIILTYAFSFEWKCVHILRTRSTTLLGSFGMSIAEIGETMK